MIFFDERRNTITLSTAATTYQMKVDSTGVLLHTYYGPRLRGGDLSNRIVHEDRGFSPNPYEVGKDRTYSLDTLPQEYSSCGVGDFRVPSVEATCGKGSRTVDLRYVGHTVREGKYALEGLPAFYDEGVTAQTLSVELRDSCTGLEVELLYGVLEEYDLITRAVRVRNGGESPMELERVSSVCLDFPAGEHDLITLGGAYAREREPVRMPLTQGVHTVGSVRGTSSHQQNPFVVLCDHETTEDAGRCWGVALVYSGSFQANTEYTQFHETRLTLGINPFHFRWTLQPGESFTTPEAAMVFSAQGLGHMSRQLHRAIRLNLCRGPWKDQRRPILINNWEATLFDFDAEKICSIAKAASQVGVEMMVMDDGWFGKRNNDQNSLGDWFVNESKLKGGLGELIDRVNALGLKFGIWYEPEMISPDSDLFRAHPDWCVHVPNRKPCIGRHQYVLDMSRKDVRDNIFDQMYSVLSKYKIDYIKWDFNRNISDAGSALLPADRQGEFFHRFILGTYELMGRIRDAFPDMLFENCSGGGGRFDPAMLAYSQQIWASDNTDPIERLTIQFGTSMCYPASTMGAHVSACDRTDYKVKGDVALWGTFGYELDPNELSAEERGQVKKQVDEYHKYYNLTHFGDLYRLKSPYEDGYRCAWSFVAEDKSEALATVVTMRAPEVPFFILRFNGLDPEKHYLCDFDGRVYSGSNLMNAGLNLTRPTERTYSSLKIYLKAQ